MRAGFRIDLNGVDLHRGGGAVLRDIHWSLQADQRWLVVGPNGAGKTQLLKLLAGAVWPDPPTGARRVYQSGGQTSSSPQTLADDIVYIGPERQDRYERYDWNFTAAAVVGTGIKRTDIPLFPLTRRERAGVTHALQQLDCQALTRRRFLTLSYGERRLILLARALAAQPKLLLLDELLAGLDLTNRNRALRWLTVSAQRRASWVLSVHRREDVPDSATHLLVLQTGRVTYAGPLQANRLEASLPSSTSAQRATVVATHQRTRSAAQRRGGPGALAQFVSASVFLEYRAVLHDINWTIRRGECWVVHGANGSGKSTLLRTLYGDHGVAAGGILQRAGVIPGVPLEAFKRRCAFVAPHLQSGYPRHATVLDVVASGRYASMGLNESPTAADRLAARRAMWKFDLNLLATRRLGELSYGQCRRVLFARAACGAPKLWLLDEALVGLDSATRRELLAVLEAVLTAGKTVIMATHHREEWPASATHELQLQRGWVRYIGPIRAVRAATA